MRCKWDSKKPFCDWFDCLKLAGVGLLTSQNFATRNDFRFLIINRSKNETGNQDVYVIIIMNFKLANQLCAILSAIHSFLQIKQGNALKRVDLILFVLLQVSLKMLIIYKLWCLICIRNMCHETQMKSFLSNT